MLAAATIRQLLEEQLSGTGNFVVDVTVSVNNKIRVFIDSMKGVSISECAELSRWLDSQLNRDVEDFELEVSSPGLDQPFRVTRQYEKNIGREVEVKLPDGTRISGKLVEAGENEFGIEQRIHEKTEGKKGRQLVEKKIRIPYTAVRETRVIIKF